MSGRSIHFPPARQTPEPRKYTCSVLGALQCALEETELAREKLRGILLSEERHGDLQVALSAVRRLEAAVQRLIEAEENA